MINILNSDNTIQWTFSFINSTKAYLYYEKEIMIILYLFLLIFCLLYNKYYVIFYLLNYFKRLKLRFIWNKKTI